MLTRRGTERLHFRSHGHTSDRRRAGLLGLAMVVVGGALVALTIALGG
ncbi:MAG: hypothetical protein WCS72_17745 [Deltaproteobacteria bacterium]